MYETFFGLKRRPFLTVPDAESYFPTNQMEEARLLIERTVRRGEGISLVFGQSGVGKSLLLRILRKSLEFDFDVVSLTSGRINNAKALLQNILHELHLPYSGADETELRLNLTDYSKNQTSNGILLLIDESQFLDPTPLDEIRLLLNNDNGSSTIFRVVLSGTCEWEEKLTTPQFDTFNQRVTTRIYLDSLSRTETFQYIAWQTNLSRINEKNKSKQNKNLSSNQSANSTNIDRINNTEKIDELRIDLPHNKNLESIFTDAAKDEIFRLTNGSPRQINQLCDAAMQLAAQQALANIDEILIFTAWGNLQQINVDVDSLNKISNKIEKNKKENYDEIIARKKNTLRLKEISSHVEYGSLDEDSKFADESIEHKSQPAYRVYKPPYPEDDLNELKKFDNNENKQIVENEFGIHNNINRNNLNDSEIESESNVDSETKTENNVSDEIDDELVEQLISFELSTATIDSSDQINVSTKPLTSTIQRKPSSLLRPVQHQLFASKILQPVRRKGERKFVVNCLPPNAENSENNAENLHAVCKSFYCYKKYKQTRKNNNDSTELSEQREECRVADKVQSINLSFTVWRSKIAHSCFGNFSARRINISSKIFVTEKHEQIVEKINNNTVEISSISIDEINPNIETNIDIDSEELEMNRESLEKYGVEVLSGRHQFVRKEPIYVYQTGGVPSYVNKSNKIDDENKTTIETETETKIEAEVEVKIEPKVESEIDRQINVTKIHQLHISNESVDYQDNNFDPHDSQTITNFDQNQNIDNEFNDDYDDNETDNAKIISIWTNSNILYDEIIDDEIIDDESDQNSRYLGNQEVGELAALTFENKLDDNDAQKEEQNYDVENSDVKKSEVVICHGGIMLNWVNEYNNSDRGFGVAYSEFAAKNGDAELKQSDPKSLIVLSSFVNRTMGQTSFNENFDETVQVKRSTITLDEIYRSTRKFQNNPSSLPDSLAEVESRIVDAVKRITQAADKIEFVAEQAEDAGRKVIDAAELTKRAGEKIDQTANVVETEIQSAIPSYKELFIQLSDFQKTLTREVQNLQYQSENLSENNRNDNNFSTDENNISLNQSHPHELKTYRAAGRRLSRPTSSDKIKLPTAEKRGSDIKTIDIKSLFIEGDL
ncbi:MAG: AAA family ATPase [Planctomycetaceae bacterium]|jgi:type II secretory pathway predicted ATPase ExeA|nr:AAA family ATPase [Planctomycetaceae bacterium]